MYVWLYIKIRHSNSFIYTIFYDAGHDLVRVFQGRLLTPACRSPLMKSAAKERTLCVYILYSNENTRIQNSYNMLL